MKTFFGRRVAMIAGAAVAALLAGCGGSSGGGSTPPPPTTYVLTVNSAAPASGVAITVTPSDNSNGGNGTTSFTRTYNSGVTVTLTAPATAGSNKFSSWSGCTTTSSMTCSVTMTTTTTVTATYAQVAVSTVTVTPGTTTAAIGTTVQFSAAVAGPAVTDSSVTWSVAGPSGSSLSAGDIDKTGLYATPYPAPTTVTITATSNQDSTVSGTATVTLAPPGTAAGPALTVDVSNQTHAINPYIYGMNFGATTASTTAAKAANLPIDRWGGDGSQRFNYLLDVDNGASDWYFENRTAGGGSEANNGFNQQVQVDQSVGSKTLGTVNVLGWISKDSTSCSFPASKYPSQTGFDPYNSSCGNGEYPQGTSGCSNANGCNITENDPTVTSQSINSANWASAWVTYLVGKFGTAANGGVFAYDLDNEPEWWDAVHRDVHPAPFTYDEVTNNGLAVAKAIKAADPTAAVSGPVDSNWWTFFYSKKDMEDGWANGPCYQPWDHPADRTAHGGVPFLEYYLQQFKAASNTAGVRLLDYLDVHTYMAATYNGNSVGLNTAGDTGAQQARLNSTRVFWDPTYTDPNLPQPNYVTDANYTSSCNVPLQPPQIIPMMKQWIANDYPGTKLAITEYNWGGQGSINGALAQADILGIFGREGLDLGTLWGPPDPVKQVPGLIAFEVFRNYDGNDSTFGDMSISSSSVDQGKLSIYSALRTSDNKVTLVVINKTYGDLTSTLSVNNLPSTTTSAKAYLYSNANLNAIVAQPNVTVTPPTGSGTASTISTTFPAQSITLLVMPGS
jgi:hypothetical protein